MLKLYKQMLLLIPICFFAVSVDAKQAFEYGDITQVNLSTRTLVISDSSYRYDSYIVIRRFGESNDQRLPVSILKKGDIVFVEMDINHKLGLPKVVRLLIFKSFDEARSYYEGKIE